MCVWQGTETETETAIVKPLKVQPIQVISDELWKMIILHLKPRHAYKLLQTNKRMYSAVKFHAHYWERVAAHIVLRDHLQLPDRSWYHMSIPTGGYHQAMEGFAALVPTLTTTRVDIFRECDKLEEEGKLTLLQITTWCACNSAEMEQNVEKETRKWSMFDNEWFENIGPKDIITAFSKKTKPRPLERRFREFLWYLEDMPSMSISEKKELVDMIDDTFYYQDCVAFSEPQRIVGAMEKLNSRLTQRFD